MHTPELFATETELAAQLDYLRQAPADGSQVALIIRRPATDERELPEVAELTPESGLVGDRWERTCSRKLPDGRLNPDSQITITGTRLLELMSEDRSRWPLIGDNFLADLDLSEDNLPAGRRLRVGTAVLEITPWPHTGCSKFSKRFGPDALRFINSPEGTRLRLRGVHAQVITAGQVRVGDRLVKI